MLTSPKAVQMLAGDKRHAREVRLVVRRVRPTPGSQLPVFTAWCYRAFLTDGPLPRSSPTTAELNSAGLAPLPASNFMGTAACLSG